MFPAWCAKAQRSRRHVARQAFATSVGQAHQSLPVQAWASHSAANLGLVPNVRIMLGVLKINARDAA